MSKKNPLHEKKDAERDDELKKAGCFHSNNHHLLQERTYVYTCALVLAFLISIE